MSVKTTALLCLLSALAGAGAYWQLATPQTVVKTEIVEKVVNRDVVKTVKVTTTPDGTKVKEVVVSDKSKEVEVAQSKGDVSKPANWLVGAFYDSHGLYSASASRRLLGPIFGSIQVSQSGTASIGLLIAF